MKMKENRINPFKMFMFMLFQKEYVGNEKQHNHFTLNETKIIHV